MSEHIPKQENWGYPPMMCRCSFKPFRYSDHLYRPEHNLFDEVKQKYQDKWRDVARNEIKKMFGEQEEPKLKVSYNGVTGELLKLELSRKEDVNTFPGVKTVREYTLSIADETDGHKHVFDNVDLGEVKFIGAAVTLA